VTSNAEPTRHALSARIRRAETLARTHSAVAGPLQFYGAIATFQQSLLEHAATATVATQDGDLRERLDLSEMSGLLVTACRWLTAQSHGTVAASARQLKSRTAEAWRQSLDDYLNGDTGPSAEIDEFIIEVVLQPFAESLCRREASDDVAEAGAESFGCPCCRALPFAATLRERGHGARRSLVCTLCQREQAALRLTCPACGETEIDRLPSFKADESFPAVRIDACDTCRIYFKTIDLTLDGAALPIVDDIATTTLDLWAAENGYRKLRKNLLRL
jgi:FdhE protein